MFLSSHLDQEHHALAVHPAHGGQALSGMGDDAMPTPTTVAPTAPAPVSTISPQFTNILIVGGVALVLFLYLRSQKT